MPLKILFVCLFCIGLSGIEAQTRQPQSSLLVNIEEYFSNAGNNTPVVVDMMYAQRHNFLEQKLRSYKRNKCLVTSNAAEALLEIQQQLLERSPPLSLVFKDCFRPIAAIDQMIRWAHSNPRVSRSTKAAYFNNPVFYSNGNMNSGQFQAQAILEHNFLSPVRRNGNGSIAFASRHSTGSTVDLTLARVSLKRLLRTGYQIKNYTELDMGSGVDSFSTKSQTMSSSISTPQRNQRNILIRAMQGRFRNYAKEWWHWTLRGEPYRNQWYLFKNTAVE